MSNIETSTDMICFTRCDESKNTIQKELILLQKWKSIADKNELLHSNSFSYFKWLNYALMIPIIILTTVSGSANILLSSSNTNLVNDNKDQSINYFQLSIGCTSLLAAILTTIYNFLKIPESQHKHFIHASNFNKISREIEMEFVIHNTEERTYTTLAEFIKTIKTEMDRQIDNAPPIPIKISKKITNDIDTDYFNRMIQRVSNIWSYNKNTTKTTTTTSSSSFRNDDNEIDINALDEIVINRTISSKNQNYNTKLEQDKLDKFKYNMKIRKSIDDE